MRMKHFVKGLEHGQIVKAIREAEKNTAGPVRVFISHRAVADPIKAAQRTFRKLRIHKAPKQNGVLVFVAPEAQKFAVLGDTAIHEKCGEEMWARITAIMAEHFKAGNFTTGIVGALALLSEPIGKSESSGGEHVDHQRGGDAQD